MIQPKKGAIALTTIPGQQSRNRYIAIEELFGERTVLRGVIFLSCYGFDHVWQRNADLVANDLRGFDLNRLRDRNRREELDNFREICHQIKQKRWLAPEEHRPKWLLVLANKVDLYWDAINSARDYYRPGGRSRFDQVAADLMKQLGTADFRYAVLPVSTESQGYSFRSFRGSLNAPTQLLSEQCTASISCLIDALEELCNA